MSTRFPVFLIVVGLSVPAYSSGLIPPLSETQIAEARKVLEDFKHTPKGPFYRIRWFCTDGTVHPPSPPPCTSRGGGHQHASLSPAAIRLAGWNIDVGTILAGQSFEQLFDTKRDHHRLKELVLESYLEEVDQGWIYRRAYSYRGARQAEDEQTAGRRFLTQLLSNPEWVGRHYFLLSQLVAVIPHGLTDGVVKKVRSLAKSIADQDSRFQQIRVKIHSSPGDEDLDAVERFLSDRGPSQPVRKLLLELTELLKREKASHGLAERLPSLRKRFADSPLASPVENFAAALEAGEEEEVFSAGAALSFEVRRQVCSSSDGPRNLELLDSNALIQEIGFQISGRLPHGTRRELLADLLDHFRYGAGAGLLSIRQFSALRGEIQSLDETNEVQAAAYHASVRYLARSTEWCRATVAKDFGPVMRHYRDVEPKASSLQDHLLRGSMALPLSRRVETLVDDADRAVGIRHSILGETSSQGVVGLNVGVALGPLRIMKTGPGAIGTVDPRGIYVIPETISDLKPMAGILTLDTGNALSHTQLLAANLGIPNAAVPSALLPVLETYRNRELFFAVTPRGVVVIREEGSLSSEERRLWVEHPASKVPRITLDASRLNLSAKQLVTLQELRRKDSGVTVGPKAANLGELASHFPNRVAPGLVIPFAVYYEHIRRDLDGTGIRLDQQISKTFAEAERMRQEGVYPSGVRRFIYPHLARFRRTIRTMPLIASFEKELIERMEREFGTDGSYGVFVRSDTNAEDLPGFSGAGLNLSVPNQVGIRSILQAIKDVWASPFDERAYEWRDRILSGHQYIYPSVILMRGVPSDKSGVIATINLETGNTDEITVNVNEGVSAVVDGGVAESLLLKPDGEVRFLQQARAPYRKTLRSAGGFSYLPPVGHDHLLSPDEIDEIRRLVDKVKAKYPASRSKAGERLPWDIEFGFESGELRLFQIRPLFRNREFSTLEAFSTLDVGFRAKHVVDLEKAP